MKIILMVDEARSAEYIREVGIEQWFRDHKVSPLVMVVKQAQGQAMECMDLNELYQPLPNQTDNPYPIEAIVHGPISLQPRRRRVLVDGRQVDLKNKEFELLQYLMQHADEIYSREQLYGAIWGSDCSGDSATVTVHINRIRKKIEHDPSNPRFIKTAHGVGYQFCTQAGRD